MINSISSITCANVYSILNDLDMFDKLPKDKQNYIINHKENYKCKFDKNIPLQFQINDKETMIVLSYLFLKYINQNADTKKYLFDRYKQNEVVYQENLREKYNPDNLFMKIEKEPVIEKSVQDDVAMMEYKETIFRKFINKIKNFFMRENK